VKRASAIPRPHEDDFEDVHWALSAASTLWKRGEDTEAVKWLRRAAGAAADHEADVRAVELFKAAAEIVGALDARQDHPTPRAQRARRQAEQARQAQQAQDERLGKRPPKKKDFGRDSTVVPPVPPEPQLSHGVMGLRFDDSEEDTMIRPETAVRRALIAIDPDHDRRTSYDHSDDLWDDWDDAEEVEPEPDDSPDSEPDSGPESEPLPATTTFSGASSTDSPFVPGALPAIRVAVLPIPEEGDVRLLFLPPGVPAPPGVAVAFLVPPTAEDAQRLAKVYRECDAKL